MNPLLGHWSRITDDLLGPLRFPRHPLTTARVGLGAVRSADGFGRARFASPEARALFAGVAAHSVRPLDELGSAGVGVMLTLAGHAVGWPVVKGGAVRLAEGLRAAFEELGGTVELNARVDSLAEFSEIRSVLLDLTPRQVLALSDTKLPSGYRNALGRYRYGAAVFKVDWALSEAIPWAAPETARAATVHVGGTAPEILEAEAAPHRGRVAERPFLIVTQPSLFDPTRAPEGKHTAWAYCHVPNGWTGDATEAIEAQVERFAPGFRDTIIGRAVQGPAALEARNANLVGGDVGGGAQDLRQTFFRPVARWDPYRTPVEGLYLCSSATPPGGGVHGMCGYHAARSALGRRASES